MLIFALASFFNCSLLSSSLKELLLTRVTWWGESEVCRIIISNNQTLATSQPQKGYSLQEGALWLAEGSELDSEPTAVLKHWKEGRWWWWWSWGTGLSPSTPHAFWSSCGRTNCTWFIASQIRYTMDGTDLLSWALLSRHRILCQILPKTQTHKNTKNLKGLNLKVKLQESSCREGVGRQAVGRRIKQGPCCHPHYFPVATDDCSTHSKAAGWDSWSWLQSN